MDILNDEKVFADTSQMEIALLSLLPRTKRGDRFCDSRVVATRTFF
jgi:hypothetical protein